MAHIPPDVQAHRQGDLRAASARQEILLSLRAPERIRQLHAPAAGQLFEGGAVQQAAQRRDRRTVHPVGDDVIDGVALPVPRQVPGKGRLPVAADVERHAVLPLRVLPVVLRAAPAHCQQSRSQQQREQHGRYPFHARTSVSKVYLTLYCHTAPQMSSVIYFSGAFTSVPPPSR